MAAAAASASLHWRPIMKSALTSCTVMAAGDAICQSLRCRAEGREISINSSQVGRFALIGLTLHGPYFHHGFQWLDRRFGASTSLSTAVIKTAVGQVTIFPVYLASFFTYMGLLEGLSLQECAQKVMHAAPSTFATGTAFWPIVNVFNFLFIPASGRVLYVNAAGLGWNSWLSYENSTRGQEFNKKKGVEERNR